MADEIDIDRLTIAELEALNHRIVERLKFLDAVQAHREMMALNIGAKVSFESPRDGRQLGTVIKFNRKTVSVVTDDGRRWNVAPQLLSPVKDVTPASSAIDAGD
ncbi:MAG: hypothetical protein WB783_05345 [Arenicellales bacterium]